MAPHNLVFTLIGACAALGRLVRLQRRLQPRSQRLCGHRRAQHHRGHRCRGACLEPARIHRPAVTPACSARPPVPSPASSRSPRLRALPARSARSSSASSPARSASGRCVSLKAKLKYDDSLDVFGVHAVGGIVGAILTGVFVNPALGGAGVIDYAMNGGAGGTADYVFSTQVMAQIKGVLVDRRLDGGGFFHRHDHRQGDDRPAPAGSRRTRGPRHHVARRTRLQLIPSGEFPPAT